MMNNTDLSVKILLQKCYTEIMETLVLENKYKMGAPNKGTTIFTDLGLYQQC